MTKLQPAPDALPPLGLPPVRPRVIPVLLLHKGQLYKPTRFKAPKYVGDPRNAVKIFNEKGADELVLLDMDASAQGRAPDYKLVEEIATESFMPVAYGGGVHNLEQARRVLGSGAEKVVLNTALFSNPGLSDEIASVFGTQSVVACADCRKQLFGGYKAFVSNGQRKLTGDLPQLVAGWQARGVGEIIVQAIDREGTRQGFDLELIRAVSGVASVPVIALGGAGDASHFKQAVDAGASAVAAGTMFVFNGPHRAVLITYPSEAVLAGLFS